MGKVEGGDPDHGKSSMLRYQNAGISLKGKTVKIDIDGSMIVFD